MIYMIPPTNAPNMAPNAASGRSINPCFLARYPVDHVSYRKKHQRQYRKYDSNLIVRY